MVPQQQRDTLLHSEEPADPLLAKEVMAQLLAFVGKVGGRGGATLPLGLGLLLPCGQQGQAWWGCPPGGAPKLAGKGAPHKACSGDSQWAHTGMGAKSVVCHKPPKWLCVPTAMGLCTWPLLGAVSS